MFGCLNLSHRWGAYKNVYDAYMFICMYSIVYVNLVIIQLHPQVIISYMYMDYYQQWMFKGNALVANIIW